MQKIELDKQRGDDLKREKAKMLDTRFAVRRQAEKQKMQLLKTVELMKKRGQFDTDELARMGIDIKSRTNNEMNNSMLTTHVESGSGGVDSSLRAGINTETPDREATTLNSNKRKPKGRHQRSNTMSVGQQQLLKK